jgi:hypothetical protein
MEPVKLSDGTAAFMSALLGTGVVLGVVYGGNLLLGDVGEGSAPSPTPTLSTIDPGDICALMDDMVAYSEEWEDSMADTGWEFSRWAEPPADEAAWLDALHEFGNAMIDGTQRVKEYLEQAADLVVDPEVKEAFDNLANTTGEIGRIQGEIEADAASWEDFTSAFDDLTNDAEYLALLFEGDAAAPIVEAYVLDTCGRDILGGGASVDANLQADVSTLGKEIATYFVDWDGVTLPEITEFDGTYLLNGSLVAMQAEGVVLSDQWMVDEVNWCVEVASEADPSAAYSYSAQAGLSEDTCESLRP